MEEKKEQKYSKIKSETIDHMKGLLEDIKGFKNKKLEAEIEKLKNELKEVKKLKKYGLVWEEKQEVFDKETIGKLPVLKEVKENDIFNDDSEANILIEGDNYHTLSVLNYTHKGKIDVIYIDPPYNTGNNDFIYNDRFVDKEDKFRHSKWLSFMSKRLKLAKKLLSDNGVIFISIDDNEIAQLKLLCDEIFGENNFLSKLVIKTSNPNGFKIFGDYPVRLKDYCLMYKNNNFKYYRQYIKGRLKWDSHFNLYIKNNNILKLKDVLIEKNFITNKDKLSDLDLNDKKFKKFYLDNMHNIFQTGFYKKSIEKKESIENRNNIIEFLSPTGLKYKLLNGRLLTNLSKSIHYIDEENKKDLSFPIGDFMGDIDYNNIQNETPLDKTIDGQKPILLIKRFIRMIKKKDPTILDFFAGSGTTGHAVLELNKEDGGNRKFILATNNENNICQDVTYERVKRVMNGYVNNKGDSIEGLGGNLKYLKTDFIDKHKSNDDLRVRMVNRCSELLCLKENIWEEVNQENEKIKLYKRNDKYLAILYDMFFLGDFKTIINTLDTENKKVSIYAFSHYKIDKEDFSGLKIPFEIEEIPDPILEVYDTIFGL